MICAWGEVYALLRALVHLPREISWARVHLRPSDPPFSFRGVIALGQHRFARRENLKAN
jgi:hypothetical protein